MIFIHVYEQKHFFEIDIMKQTKLIDLLEGFAWERRADGSLPTLADTTRAYAERKKANTGVNEYNFDSDEDESGEDESEDADITVEDVDSRYNQAVKQLTRLKEMAVNNASNIKSRGSAYKAFAGVIKNITSTINENAPTRVKRNAVQLSESIKRKSKKK